MCRSASPFCRARPRPPRSGFTLVELTVALTIGALVVLLAHRVATEIIDAARVAAEARRASDRDANARRLLAALLTSIDVRNRSGEEFDGTPVRLAFASWQDDARAIPRRVRIVLRVADGALVAEGTVAGNVTLAEGVDAVGFDYLLARGANEQWVPRWFSGASAPEAVRVRVTSAVRTDTLLFIVGTRG